MLELVQEASGPVHLLDFGCGPAHLLDYIKARPSLTHIRYTGLDLSDKCLEAVRRRLVQRIGKVLSHPIHLSSRPGTGSVFGISVPLGEAAVAEAQKARPVAAPGGQLGGCVVLCIDNEPAILDGMRQMLENWQCTVLIAAGTEDALTLLENGAPAPNLILADYHLETETGVVSIELLRKRIGEHIAAILITADRSPDVEEEAERENLYLLRKPIKPAALRALMSRLMQQQVAAE
jgi:CheY-like chemotaxis protein